MFYQTIILFDGYRWEQLLPLTFTKPVCNLKIGIDTIREKWEYFLQTKTYSLSEKYLNEKYPAEFSDNNIYINGGIVPNNNLIIEIGNLKAGEVLKKGTEIIAFNSPEHYTERKQLQDNINGFKPVEFLQDYISVSRPWHLFQYNDVVLRSDFSRITADRISQPLSATNTLLGDNIFIEQGATVEASIINTTTGPIYIGKHAEIMEGCMLRGPIALNDNATLKMGAKIYGATTIGNYSKVGGEMSNSILMDYSNKGHDGFLGNSVIGEWCNLGADTNNSNLKNNYAEVRLWDYSTQKFVYTGLQFCGLIMGDHSKCSINTMFNTGTVVGVNVNIFGDGFPRNFIPSFSWGGAAGFITYKLKDAFEVAEEVMKRRQKVFDITEKKILTMIYEMSEKYRKGQLIFLGKS